MYALKRGFSNIHLFDPKSFEEKYGIRIDQFLDLKALKGDSSDNIPGVPGVGEKTAVALLQQYGTLDGVYEHIDEVKSGLQKKLIDGKDSAYMSKKVAEIWHDAPVELDLEEAVVTNLDGEALGSLLSRLEFTSLLKSMPKILHTSGGGAAPEVAPLVKSVVNNTTLTRLLMEPQALMDVWKNGSKTESYTNDMYCRFKSRPTQDITAYYAGQIGKVSIEWNGEIYLRKTGQTQYSEETGIEGGDSRTIESDFTADSWMHASKLVLSFPVWKGTLKIGNEFTESCRANLYTIDEQGTDLPGKTGDQVKPEFFLQTLSVYNDCFA
jgi:hypothetical protein